MLIVDDHAENRLLLQAILTPLGVEIDEAAIGEEALAKFQAHRPDVVLMDMRVLDKNSRKQVIKVANRKIKSNTR